MFHKNLIIKNYYTHVRATTIFCKLDTLQIVKIVILMKFN